MARGAIVASAWVVSALLLASVSGCSVYRTGRPRLMPASPLADVTTAYRRVLVAGFSSDVVAGVDPNEETSRLLRRELRTEASVQVVEAEPLQLERDVFVDVPFWRRVGEEYRDPLIVTGVVDFKSIGHRYEERTVGRRVIRLWLPQFSLALRLVLIDGRTGKAIGSAQCGPIVTHAVMQGERALTLYYRLIDRAMPSILAIFGRRMMQHSSFAITCRAEREEGRAES